MSIWIFLDRWELRPKPLQQVCGNSLNCGIPETLMIGAGRLPRNGHEGTVLSEATYAASSS